MKNGTTLAGMPSKNIIILLDTMIVAGIFAVTKSTDGKSEENKQEWKRAVDRLANIDGKSYKLRVPTPVCYELMCWNKAWKEFVLSKTEEIFHFATYHIHNSILQIAADFSNKSEVIYYDDKRHKVKSMDPILAGYSIKYGHYILTANESDFPESHFSVIRTDTLMLYGKKGKYRSTLFLLKPIWVKAN